jgi:hypothetical protein
MRRSFLGALAITLVSTLSVFGQTFTESGVGFEAFYLDFSGGGARAEGMGKAFIGVSDDVTGGSWNPAGIIGIEKPVMNISFSSLSPRGESSGDFTYLDSTFSSTNKHSGSFSSVSSLNFVVPIRIKGHGFVGSFSYVRNYDEYQQLSLWFENEYAQLAQDSHGTIYLDTVKSRTDVSSELQGGMNSVSFSFGTRIYKSISVGLSANVYAGRAVRNQTTITSTDSVTRDVLTWQPVLREVRTDAIDTNRFQGLSFTLGAKHRGDRLDAGLVLRLPFDLKVKNGKSIYNYLSDNGYIVSDGTDTTFYDNRLIKYSMPLMIGVGAAYHYRPNVLLALDAEYRGFSSTKIKYRDSLRIESSGTNEEYYTEYEVDWRDVFLVRCGVEWMLSHRFGTTPLRFGLGIEPLPAPSVEVNAKTGKVSRKTPVALRLSTGTGIHWSQIRLDVAYTYMAFSQDVANAGYFTAVMKNRNHHVTASFTGVF